MVPWEGLSMGGGPGSSDRKKTTSGVFYLVFLVLNFFLIILHRCPMVYFKKNFNLQGSTWGPTFSRGRWGGGGGVNL